MKEKVTVNQRTVRTSAGGNRTAELPPNECNTANLIGRLNQPAADGSLPLIVQSIQRRDLEQIATEGFLGSS
jgi:hypothetical protein